MIRNSRRVVALAIAGAVAIAPVISGCGAGFDPQTSIPTQLTEGVNVSVPIDSDSASQVEIRNMFVLGPQNGAEVAAGGSVPLYAGMINRVNGQPDRLIGVNSADFQSAQIKGGGVQLPPHQLAWLTGSDKQPSVVLRGLTRPLRGGESLSLTLRFERAGSATVLVPVVPAQGEYATLSPVPTPTETPRTRRSGSPEPTGTASPGTASPGATATASPATGH